MIPHFDIIIAGAGSMGAPAAFYASKKGIKLLALEQFPHTPHEQGSHTGQSRIIRKAYFEDPGYIPLLEKAYRGWAEIENLSGEKVFEQCGLVYCGPPGHPVITGVKRAASAFNLPVSVLNSFDHFKTDQLSILFEKEAGFVMPEKAIRIFCKEAQNKGAEIRTGEKLIRFNYVEGAVLVETSRSIYTTDRLIITAGAWAAKLLQEYDIPLKVTRQLVVWVEPPQREKFVPEDFPCWMIAAENVPGVYYGFPYLDGQQYPGPTGLKFAWHHADQPADPDKVNREVTYRETIELVDRVAEYFPAARGKIVATKTCLYTNTPDEHFVIDYLPDTDNKVVIAAGFSGHGFKFAPAIGELLLEMALEEKARPEIDFLSLKRFTPAAPGY